MQDRLLKQSTLSRHRENSFLFLAVERQTSPVRCIGVAANQIGHVGATTVAVLMVLMVGVARRWCAVERAPARSRSTATKLFSKVLTAKEMKVWKYRPIYRSTDPHPRTLDVFVAIDGVLRPAIVLDHHVGFVSSRGWCASPMCADVPVM